MRWIKIVMLALASLLGWSQVLADWDARLEAQEQARRAQSAAVERQKQAQMKAMKERVFLARPAG